MDIEVHSPSKKKLWDLQPVFDLLEAFNLPPASKEEPEQLDDYDPKSAPSRSLGDFDRLAEFFSWELYLHTLTEYAIAGSLYKNRQCSY